MVSTRARPSPSGHQQLPANTRRPSRITRPMRLTPTRRVDTGATAVTKLTSSQDVVATNQRQQTPPTTTSRSQSPHLDTESDSPTQVPESRSTSPPITNNNSRTLRSQTRSVSPSAIVQKTQPNRASSATATSKKATKVAGKKRNQPEPDTSEDENVATSNTNTAVEERRIKRTRTGERGGIHGELEALFADQPEEAAAAFANESSADDGTAQPVHPLKISRSRSTSRQLPSVIENNSEDAGSEDSSSDAQRPAEGHKPLGRRSAIMSRSTSTQGEKMPDDMEFRRQVVREQYNGLEIPNLPKTKDGLHRSGNEIFEESLIEDDEAEFDVWGGPTHSPTLARKLLKDAKDAKSFGRSKSSLNPTTPQSKDKSQTGKQNGATASSSRPSTKSLQQSLNPSKINIPASGSRKELVLTYGPLLESAHALVKYAEDNPSCRLPTGAEMKALLAEFNARDAANTTSAAASSSSQQEGTEARPDITSSDQRRIDQQTPDPESGSPNNEMSIEQDAEIAGEVAIEVPEPRTPTPQTPQKPQAQESRGWLSGIATVAAKVATTPFNAMFGRRNQSTDSPTTNGVLVVGSASNAHLIPQTSDFNVPATPINTRDRRRHLAQTERKHRSSIKSRVGPQTEKKQVRFHIPIEQRGVLTPEQIAEAHRKEDEDRNLQARQNRRASMQATVDDADERDANQSVQSAQPGEKRKRYHPEHEHSPGFNHEGHFEFPYQAYESDESDTESTGSVLAVEALPSQQNTKIELVNLGIRELSAAVEKMTETELREAWSRVQVTDRYDLSESLPGYLKAKVIRLGMEMPTPEGVHISASLAATPKTTELKAYFDSIYAPAAGPSSAGPSSISGGLFGATSTTPSSTLPKHPLYRGSSSISSKLSSATPTTKSAASPKKSQFSASNGNSDSYARSAEATLTPNPLLAEVLGGLSAPPAPTPNPFVANTSASFFGGSATAPPIAWNPYLGNTSGSFFEGATTAPTPTSNPFYAANSGGLFGRATTAPAPPLPPSAAPATSSSSLFDRMTAPAGDSRIGSLAAGAHTLEPAAPEPDSEPTPAPSQNIFFPSSANLSGAATTQPSRAPAATPATLSGGLFDRMTAPVGDSRIGSLAAGAHVLEPAAPEPAQASTSLQSSPGLTFSAPEYDSESDSDEDESVGGDKNADQPEAQHTRENAAGDDTALQPRTWTQTPPPKPKPSNAQLPQIPAQPSAADLAKARAEKYKPAVPSKLSQSTVMTPPHNDKENRVPEAQAQALTTQFQATESVEELKKTWRAEMELDRSRFDPEVLREVDAAPEIPTAPQIPASFFDVRAVFAFDEEVLSEVGKHF